MHLNTLQRNRKGQRFKFGAKAFVASSLGEGLYSPRIEIACSRACTACNLFLWFENPWASRMCVNSSVCLSLGMLYITVSDSMISDGLSEIWKTAMCKLKNSRYCYYYYSTVNDNSNVTVPCQAAQCEYSVVCYYLSAGGRGRSWAINTMFQNYILFLLHNDSKINNVWINVLAFTFLSTLTSGPGSA